MNLFDNCFLLGVVFFPLSGLIEFEECDPASAVEGKLTTYNVSHVVPSLLCCVLNK